MRCAQKKYLQQKKKSKMENGPLKILIAGSCGVGKSALIERFCVSFFEFIRAAQTTDRRKHKQTASTFWIVVCQFGTTSLKLIVSLCCL